MKIHDSNRNLFCSLLFALISLLCSATVFAAEEQEEGEPAVPEGPHGGRLLTEGDFALELAIIEDATAPEFNAWAYHNDEELDPSDWQLTVRVTRLDGQIEEFSFAPAGDLQRGQGAVEEPHSFDVAVSARYDGQTYAWNYPSYEGRVQLTPELTEALSLETSVAGPGALQQTILLYGRTTPDPQGVSHVGARYPGLIRSISANIGQRVQAGDALAVIEANNSLQPYTITAPIDGLVIERHANPGEFAGDQPLLTIADYSRVWADFDVFPGDAGVIAPGQPVTVSMNGMTVQSSILFLNPGAGDTPNVIARVPLDNPEGRWTPGLLVEGEVVTAVVPVPLLVNNLAIQTMADEQVVFIRVGNNYENRAVSLGRTDGEFTEVLEGISAGDEYVVTNSYLLKADVEKAGAAHDH